MKTSFPKPSAPQWYVVDAADRVLGRLSTSIATVLRGRHRANFVPHIMCPDHVIVINADKIKVTGNKAKQKTYYRHTGWLGHLRTTTFDKLMEKDPSRVIVHAVKGMLPKNASRQHILKHLHIYSGSTHEHQAQQPAPFPL
mgnify:CR=1 FL=1